MMKRISRKHAQQLFDGDDEDKLYERQSLINASNLDEEYDDADDHTPSKQNSATIRQRQAANKNKLISNNYSINNNNIIISNSSNRHNEELELKNVNGQHWGDTSPDYTYYDIQPGDTLQSICLRYACPINQVKRLNSLMTDQEFYGLRRLKLPLGKLGLLEDVLKSQRESASNNDQVLSSLDPNTSSPRTRFVISPGSAMSVSCSQNCAPFKPLLSPGYSSDRISEMYNSAIDQNLFKIKPLHNHSHSFSSLREFTNGDININIGPSNHQIDIRTLKEQNFIRHEVNQESIIDADDIQAVCQDNVDKVFQDLDYHVERAKVAVETYDRRATDLVDEITNNGPVHHIHFSQSKTCKIPQLFICNENFGLNLKKLFAFILIVCLILPLVYIISRQKNV